MDRRKFLQISALVCAAPAINKINSIVTVNVDSCIPDVAYNWTSDMDIVTPLDIFREVAEKLIKNGMVKGTSGKIGIILNDKMDMIITK